MSTPQEEDDILREQAITQIIEQIRQEYAKRDELPPSQAALRIMAKKRHDESTHLT